MIQERSEKAKRVTEGGGVQNKGGGGKEGEESVRRERQKRA